MRIGAVAALAWLFVGPRIDLPFAGLRVEDLVFALLGAVCLVWCRTLGRPAAPTLGILAVVVTSVLSAVVWSAIGTIGPVSALLFAVRPLEYWIVFPAVRLVLSTDTRLWQRRLEAVLAGVTVLQSGFAALQYFAGLPIGFSHASYARAAGLTVGPYELGAMSAALLVLWVARQRFVLAAVAAVGLVTSISRISIVGAVLALALLAGWTVVARRRGRRQTRLEGPRLLDRILPHGATRGRLARTAAAAAATALLVGAGIGLLSSPAGQSGIGAALSPIASRFETTSVIGSWNAAGVDAAKVPPVHGSAEYIAAAYGNMGSYVQAADAAQSGAEPSNLVRFFRWHLILDTMNSPGEWLLGLGPSYIGPSVDGSYLRFLADAGLLGAAAWVFLIVAWLRRSPPWMVAVTVTMLVGGVFIDILYAERPMALFWTLLALSWTVRGPGPAEPGRHRRALARPTLRPRRPASRRIAA